jgi:hypothetical protein
MLGSEPDGSFQYKPSQSSIYEFDTKKRLPSVMGSYPVYLSSQPSASIDGGSHPSTPPGSSPVIHTASAPRMNDDPSPGPRLPVAKHDPGGVYVDIPVSESDFATKKGAKQ